MYALEKYRRYQLPKIIKPLTYDLTYDFYSISKCGNDVSANYDDVIF